MLRWLNNSLLGKQPLGPLESRLLRALWKRGDATVRELLTQGDIDAAYTTVMTTLDRMYKKGLLERASEGQGRAFRYRTKHTQQEFYRTVVGADLSHLLASGSDPSLPVSFLVDAITEHDAALLDELTRAVNRKKRELRRTEKP